MVTAEVQSLYLLEVVSFVVFVVFVVILSLSNMNLGAILAECY